MPHKILVIDDNDTLRRQLRDLLLSVPHDCEYYEACNEQEAIALIDGMLFSVVVTDIDLVDTGGKEIGGLLVLDAAKRRCYDTQVVVVTGHMRADLFAEVRRRQGFSCVDRGAAYFADQLPDEVTDAIRFFERARSQAHMSFRVFVPTQRADPLQFQLTPEETCPRLARRGFTLDLDAMKEATAGIGSLILLNEQGQCAALSQFVGRYLWDRLFGEHDDLLLRLGEGRGMTRHPANLPIRIISERDALDVPFELLHDGNEYLALNHPLVREVRGARAKAPRLPALQRALADRENPQPLRVLLIAADTCSEKESLCAIPMVDKEVQLVRDLFEHHRFPVKPIIEVLPSWKTNHDLVQSKLHQGWHVVHYAGHGTHDQANNRHLSSLHFWERSCSESDWQSWHSAARESPAAATRLRGRLLGLSSTDLLKCLGSPVPSLVYLSCCHSARTADMRSLLFTKSLGLVDAVAEAGVPTVVGHRWPLVDTEKSLQFVKTFYEKLLGEDSPEQAILSARSDLREYDSIWASSVMYVCSGFVGHHSYPK